MRFLARSDCAHHTATSLTVQRDHHLASSDQTLGSLADIHELLPRSRSSNTLEETHYPRRSADYAWQLLGAASAILALSYPLKSVVNFRPLLIALTYVSSQLAPPGSTTSIMGMISIPVLYYPYAMVAMDLALAGTSTAAAGVVGLVTGHAWWWAVFGGELGRGPLAREARAPGWLKRLLGDGPEERPVVGRRREGEDEHAGPGPVDGVHIVRPAGRAAPGGSTTGYQWGAGHRLG
ncbi:hypothetical protein HWV62_8807 [Athelia sp. TMB]|nr:hypothetical protein HWV62_8807 [Athelia sp. TMB]